MKSSFPYNEYLRTGLQTPYWKALYELYIQSGFSNGVTFRDWQDRGQPKRVSS